MAKQIYFKYAAFVLSTSILLFFFNNCAKYKYTAIDEQAKAQTLSQTPVFSEPDNTPPVEPTSPVVTVPPVEPTSPVVTVPPVEPTSPVLTVPPVEPTSPVVTIPPVQIPVKFLCSNRRTKERGTNFILAANNISVDIVQYEFVRRTKSDMKRDLKEISRCREESPTLAQEIKETKKIPLKKCIPEGEFIASNFKFSKKMNLKSDLLKKNKNKLIEGNKYYTAIVYGNNETILNTKGSKKTKTNRNYIEILFDINKPKLSNSELEKYSTNVENQDKCDKRASPLFVDLRNGSEKQDSIKLTAPWQGVDFDIMGENAEPEAHAPYRISWFQSSAFAFITLPNSDGQVLGIDQLFGDNTQGPDKEFAENGYDALAKYDENDDNLITSEDSIYSQLRIWQDYNLNGQAEANELKSLMEYDLITIDLNYDDNFREVDHYGNAIKYKSVVKTKSGDYKLMFDVWFKLDR